MEKPKFDLPSEYEEAGNAFVILGRANRIMKEAGWSEEKRTQVLEEAKSGDYNNLRRTMGKYFDTE